MTQRQAISKDLTGRLAKTYIGRPTAEARENARRNLAALALEQDDPAGWLAEMLSVLGLREPAP